MIRIEYVMILLIIVLIKLYLFIIPVFINGNYYVQSSNMLFGSIISVLEILSKYSPIPSDIILFGWLVTIPPIILLSRYNEAGWSWFNENQLPWSLKSQKHEPSSWYQIIQQWTVEMSLCHTRDIADRNSDFHVVLSEYVPDNHTQNHSTNQHKWYQTPCFLK